MKTLKEIQEIIKNMSEEDREELQELMSYEGSGTVGELGIEHISQQVDEMDGDWRLYLNVFKVNGLILGATSTDSSWGDCENVNVDDLFEVKEIQVPKYVRV